MNRIGACLLVGIGLLGLPGSAGAHPLAPSVLTFERAIDGSVTMRWRAPLKRPTGQSLRPVIPDDCEATGPARRVLDEDGMALTETVELRCNPPDMVGTQISVEGFEDSKVSVVVRVVHLSGEVNHAILDAENPELTIVEAKDQSHDLVEYLALGIEHLTTGWDHLTFVLGLLILFGWCRRLVAAVTAFTLGHSVTLALSVLGVLAIPQALVEALIALTIVVLALEIQSGSRGIVWRHPWALPGSLGLLHGLGFASVLFDAGLPAGEIPLALLGFNVGLEIGQLFVIGVAWLGYRAIRSAIPERWRVNRTLPAFVIGTLAAFWVIERTVTAFQLMV